MMMNINFINIDEKPLRKSAFRLNDRLLSILLVFFNLDVFKN